MSTTVTSIPKVTRKTKYDYDTLFNGDIHRYVKGEDFKVSEASFRGALYGRKTDLNEGKPVAEQFGLTVQFRDEDGLTVAYIQRTAVKAKKPAVKKPAKKTAAAPAAK